MGGVLRAKNALQNTSKQNSEKSQSSTALSKNEANNPEGLFLNITSPEDNSVVEEAKINLTGQTSPDAYVAIASEKEDYLIKPNELGSFSQEIPLIKGANTIKITVYLVSGEKQEKSLNIVYTTAKIE